ncbi:MAG: MBL fold metallo-hydrolase [Actinobacteria bacterium]|nr:MBL fold metallo-hydrolase [Actinomycetota bacterium]
MLIESFPAGPWETNCYVIAPSEGEDAIVVDPGFAAASPLRDVLRERRLRAVAVVLTHGHMDHVWSVVPVCAEHELPAYIHPGDREEQRRTRRHEVVCALGCLEPAGHRAPAFPVPASNGSMSARGYFSARASRRYRLRRRSSPMVVTGPCPG